MADEKLVSYKLLRALGENEEGSVVQLPEGVGDALVEAGLAELATEDDGAGEQEEEGAEEYAAEPVVANSLKKLGKRIEKTLADSVAHTLSKTKPAAPVARVAAEVKTPAIKSLSDLVHWVYKAEFGRSTEAYNRLGAYNLDLQQKAILGVNETTAGEGGYTVNPEFSNDIWTRSHDTISLPQYCQQIAANSETINVREISETSLANGSIFGGIQIYATGEGASLTASKPTWTNVPLTLQKFTGLVYYTNEVLQDTSYPLEAEMEEMFRTSFVYFVNEQIIQGSTLEGLLNAPSYIGVTTSSSAGTISYADLAKMESQLYERSKPNAIWLYNPQLSYQLNTLTYTAGGTQPYRGLTFDPTQPFPYRMFGRPMFPCWQCSAVGTPGDILVLDLKDTVFYHRPFRIDVSRDFQFGTDQIAVRFVLRCDHKNRWRTTVTGPHGSTEYSNVVGIASRGT